MTVTPDLRSPGKASAGESMKRIIFILAACSWNLAFAEQSPEAQQRDAQASLYERSIAHEVNVLNTLTQSGTGLTATQVGLLENGHAMVRAYEIADAQAKDQRAEAAVQNADAAKQHDYANSVTEMVNVHNRACSGTVPQNVYDWCLKVDAPRIAPMITSANEWGDRVNAAKVVTDNAASKVDANNKLVYDAELALKARMQANLVQDIAYVNSYNASIQRIQDWSDKLYGLKDEFDSCRHSLDSHETFERIHEVCGSMFDGNTIHQFETDHRIPDSTFMAWKGPAFCSSDNKFCVSPGVIPEVMVLR
jgi:hypothetical protein